MKKVNFPKNATLGGLIRNGEPMLIDGDTQIEPYDHVDVVCLDDAIRNIQRFFD